MCGGDCRSHGNTFTSVVSKTLWRTVAADSGCDLLMLAYLYMCVSVCHSQHLVHVCFQHLNFTELGSCSARVVFAELRSDDL